LFAGFSVTTLPPGILIQGILHILAGKIRPQTVAEIKLGVSELPQQKITQSVLTTGADEQIWIGALPERKLASENLFIYLLR
jgi:hypothetical protein